MKIVMSATLMHDVLQTMNAAIARSGIVNVPRLAEEIRRRNETENIALEDIAERLMRQAQTVGAAMEFDSYEKSC